MSRVLFILVMLSLPVQSATWYAAPTGNSLLGTRANPWSISYAFTNNAANTDRQPGDTIKLMSGTFHATEYSATYEYTNLLIMRGSGTVESPLRYESEDLWGFVYDGGLVHPFTSTNIILWGLRADLSSTSIRNRTNGWQMPPVLQLAGSNISVLHCLLDNSSHLGIFAGRSSPNKYFGGVIARFTGINDWSFNSGIQWEGAARGPGMYIENETSTCVIEGFINIYSYTQGILWKNYIAGFRNTNCYSIDSGGEGFLLQQKDTPCQDFTFVNGGTWMRRAGGPGIVLGDNLYPQGFRGSNDLVLNNIFAGALKGASFQGQFSHHLFRSNQVIRLGLPGDGSSDQPTEYNIAEFEESSITNSYAHTFQGNLYRADGTNNWAWSTTNFSGWPTFTNTTQGGASDTYNMTLPTGVEVRAFSPSTDTNFVYVMVYNWDSDASTTVDLSAYFNEGSHLRVYDMQDLPNYYDTLVYEGGSISLDLDRTAYTAMNGSFSGRTGTNAWDGFDPQFRGFVVYAGAHIGTLLSGNFDLSGKFFLR